jgi:EAL domain-containing protein (putative c-di-GMP-specific phosphodiesterase class I)
MPKIGEWSLREACRQLTVWHAVCPQVRPLTVSVNFALLHFLDADLAALIQQTLHDTGLDPSSLKIEITESDMMQHPKAVTAVLQQLAAQGIETCLDDFGTGIRL